MPYEQKFLFSLLLTLIVEIPIVIFFIKYFYKYKALKNSQIIFAGFLASTLTLPYFWFILPVYISGRIPYILIGESLVIIIEAIIYWRLFGIKFKEALIISLTANLASTLVGLLF